MTGHCIDSTANEDRVSYQFLILVREDNIKICVRKMEAEYKILVTKLKRLKILSLLSKKVTDFHINK